MMGQTQNYKLSTQAQAIDRDRLAEQERANKASEAIRSEQNSVSWSELAERSRHNAAQEDIDRLRAGSSSFRDYTQGVNNILDAVNQIGGIIDGISPW